MKYISFTIVLILIVMVFVPFVVGADDTEYKGLVPCGGQGEAECTFGHLILMVSNLVKWLFIFSVPLTAISFAYAGFLYLTAGGDPGKAKQGKEIFTKVMWGFVIMLSAWLIVTTFANVLLCPDFKSAISNIIDVGLTNTPTEKACDPPR